jgi:putative transposase
VLPLSLMTFLEDDLTHIFVRESGASYKFRNPSIQTYLSAGMNRPHAEESVSQRPLPPGGHSDLLGSEFTSLSQFQVQLESVYGIIHFISIDMHRPSGIAGVPLHVHIAVGVRLDGQRVVLGAWFSPKQDSYWTGPLEDLHSRGLKDLLVVCVDSRLAFEDALQNTSWGPCVVTALPHVINESLSYVPSQEKRAIRRRLRSLSEVGSSAEAWEVLLGLQAECSSLASALARRRSRVCIAAFGANITVLNDEHG